MSDLGIYNLYERTNPGTIETFQKRTASKMDLQTEYEKIIEDTEWIDLMETTIPYIDNIFRNPNRFIINEVSYFGPGARKELPTVVAKIADGKSFGCYG